jgi:hypothetical protein
MNCVYKSENPGYIIAYFKYSNTINTQTFCTICEKPIKNNADSEQFKQHIINKHPEFWTWCRIMGIVGFTWITSESKQDYEKIEL